MLKRNTKEVLYEKFRTEKLLARRATQNITEDDRERLMDREFLVAFVGLRLALNVTLPASSWTKTDFTALQQDLGL